MPEIKLARRLPLAGQPTSAENGAASIRILGPAVRFALRLPGDSLTRHPTAAGFRLDQPINRLAGEGARISARLGPDEWLLIAPDGDALTLEREIATELSATRHSLVDISHRNTALAISGRQAATVLNAGCPLDLDIRAFPTGMATRTLIGKAEVILMRLSDEPTFRVECWRSFARYLHALLAEAAREFR